MTSCKRKTGTRVVDGAMLHYRLVALNDEHQLFIQNYEESF